MIYVDGRQRSTLSYNAGTARLSYTSGRFSDGRHMVRIIATDAAGNRGDESWKSHSACTKCARETERAGAPSRPFLLPFEGAPGACGEKGPRGRMVRLPVNRGVLAGPLCAGRQR